MALDSRGLRHQTEASEAGSRAPVGISRTTGVTKTCRATGAVAGSETWVPWKVEIIMDVASIQALISTSGLHPDLQDVGAVAVGSVASMLLVAAGSAPSGAC
jgi:hypothetical protein